MGNKAIVAILICTMMAALPIATTAGDEEPFGDGMPMWDMWWPEPGHFNYSEGKVVGNYLFFEINVSTGIVTDYTVTISTFDAIYPMLIYEETWYIDETGEIVFAPTLPEINLTYENVTIFESIEIKNFTANGHPGMFGDLFIFQGEDTLMMFYDRDWNQGYYASGDMNNTIVLDVAEGLEILDFMDYWKDKWYYDEEREEEEESGGEGEEWGEEPWDDLFWEPLWTEIWIESENTTTSILIYDGDATIENNTITVNLKPNGYLEISTWAEMPFYPIIDDLWYGELEFEEEMKLIEEAKEDGLIAGEGWYFEVEDGEWYLEEDPKRELDNSDFYSYKDPTFTMEFINIGEDWIDIVVDSEIPYGRIVMLNLNDEVLRANSMDDLLVKLDGTKIESTDTLEELMELADTGATEAKFFALLSESGTTVFVYIPHFSTHTITIESILSTSLDVLVPTVLASVLIAVAAAVIVLRGRKGQDEF